MITIIQEQPNNYNITENIVKLAFESAQHSDGNEHILVKKLRQSSAFIPELSLIAKNNNQIIGHIMFSKIKINETTQIALAPISVLPKFQKQGIGGMLIKEGHKIAKELGFEFSVVLGDPLYYTKFGYIPAYNFKIKPPFNINTEYYMAINLQGKTTILDGIVKYSKEFFE